MRCENDLVTGGDVALGELLAHLGRRALDLVPGGDGRECRLVGRHAASCADADAASATCWVAVRYRLARSLTRHRVGRMRARPCEPYRWRLDQEPPTTS